MLGPRSATTFAKCTGISAEKTAILWPRCGEAPMPQESLRGAYSVGRTSRLAFPQQRNDGIFVRADRAVERVVANLGGCPQSAADDSKPATAPLRLIKDLCRRYYHSSFTSPVASAFASRRCAYVNRSSAYSPIGEAVGVLGASELASGVRLSASRERAQERAFPSRCVGPVKSKAN